MLQRIYTISLIVVLFVINAYTFKDNGSIFSYLKMRSKLKKAQQDLREAELLMHINISAMIDLREMRISMDTVETFARNRLFYGKKDEKIFICDE